jgi:predicted PurR-regulated permease PerM
MITESPPASPAPDAASPSEPLDKVQKAAVIGIFLILAVGLLYFAKDFFLPVSLAFLLALVLSPVVRGLRRRGIPEPVSAILLVVFVLAGLGASVYGLSGPLAKWVDDAPSIAAQMQQRFASVRGPVQKIIEASGHVEQMGKKPDQTVQKVVVEEPGILTRAATGLPSVATHVGVTLILLLFLLASGDMFYEKLVKSLPTFGDKIRGVKIARDVEREVSRYLLTVTMINVGLGVAIFVAMYVTGLPNPGLWGMMAAVFNFIPYIGAFTGLALVSIVSLVSFDTLYAAMWPPLAFAGITLIEGQFLSPLLVGRRLELNVVAVFVAVAFWSWIWGLIGAFMAVPMLVTVKVFADHVDGLGALGEFLAARDAPPAEARESQE